MRRFIITFNIRHYNGQCTVIEQTEFQDQHNCTLSQEMSKALIISLKTLVSVSSPSLGPHCFIVPVCDENGSMYPGVTAIDMMYKEGESPGDPSPTLLCTSCLFPTPPSENLT